MNLAFLYQGPIPAALAQVMVESARKHIPKCWVIQLSDMDTPPLPFVNEVRRKQSTDLVDARFAHQEDLDDAIVIDYDCIVQRDIGRVFEQPFDLAVTRRPAIDRTASKSAAAAMPHNLGVIFQRSGAKSFWGEVRDTYGRLEGTDQWLAGQVLVTDAIKRLRNDFHIIELPGEYYNYTPKTEDEDVRARAVVHYKGHRKPWMLKGYPEADILAAKDAGEMVDRMVEKI